MKTADKCRVNEGLSSLVVVERHVPTSKADGDCQKDVMEPSVM